MLCEYFGEYCAQYTVCSFAGGLVCSKAVSSRGTRECAEGGGGLVKPARDGAAIGCGKGQRGREAHSEAHALRALCEVAASRVAGAVAGRKVVLERGVAHAAILALAVDVQRGRARLVPVNTGHGRGRRGCAISPCERMGGGRRVNGT